MFQIEFLDFSNIYNVSSFPFYRALDIKSRDTVFGTRTDPTGGKEPATMFRPTFVLGLVRMFGIPLYRVLQPMSRFKGRNGRETRTCSVSPVSPVSPVPPVLGTYGPGENPRTGKIQTCPSHPEFVPRIPYTYLGDSTGTKALQNL